MCIFVFVIVFFSCSELRELFIFPNFRSCDRDKIAIEIHCRADSYDSYD